MPAADDRPRGVHPGWVLGLLLVVFAVYAPSLANGYALDGPLAASSVLPDGARNSMTSRLRPVGDYFAENYWEGNGGEPSRLYRPITVLSFALCNAVNRALGGDAGTEPLPHHLLNVLLHVWCVWLAWRLLLGLAAPVPALLGAAVFGLHAIHSEVVAGVVGRAELFAFAFGAAGLLLYLDERPAGDPARRIARRAAAAALWWLAFCSKESGLAWVPFAFVFAVLRDWHRGAPGAVLRHAVGVAAVAVVPLCAFFVLRHLAVAGIDGDTVHYLANPLYYQEPLPRVWTAVMIWGYGLFKCVWPTALVSDYGPVTFAVLDAPGDPRFLAAAAVLALLVAAALACMRRAPLVTGGVACLLGFGFLTSNVPFAIGTVFGERLFFTPSLGIGFLAAFAASRASVWGRAPAIGVAAVWMVVCAVVILGRNAAWRDEDTRRRMDGVANPDSLRLADALASIRAAEGDRAAAAAIWERLIRLDGDAVKPLTNYGVMLAESGEFARAEALFQRALVVPEHRLPLRHVTRLNLAVLYERMGRAEDTRAQLRQAWKEPDVFRFLHEPLLEATQIHLPVDEVRAILAEGERRRPEHPTWPLQRGGLALREKDWGRAVGELRRARALRPAHDTTRWQLAVALLQSGDRDGARALAAELRDDPKAAPELRARAAKLLQ